MRKLSVFEDILNALGASSVQSWLLMKACLPFTDFLSSTQLALKLISLLLISTTVWQPLTLEMYTPFNLFCLSGFVAWITWEKKKKKKKDFLPNLCSRTPAAAASLACVKADAWQLTQSVHVCVIFRRWAPT